MRVVWAAIVGRGGAGRPRRYCRQSCRQRDYEARRRSAELGLSEGELVVTRAELESVRDRLYVLLCAVEDVEPTSPNVVTIPRIASARSSGCSTRRSRWSYRRPHERRRTTRSDCFHTADQKIGRQSIGTHEIGEQSTGAQSIGSQSIGAQSTGASSNGAHALGALAVGAVAVGALAIGALAIGRLAIGRAKIKQLDVGTLHIGRLVVDVLELRDAG